MKLWNKVKGWLTGSKETTDEDKELLNHFREQKSKKKAKGLNAKKKRNKERKARKQGNIN